MYLPQKEGINFCMKARIWLGQVFPEGGQKDMQLMWGSPLYVSIPLVDKETSWAHDRVEKR